MSPHEFVESLSRHYSKRHASDDAAKIWIREMIDLVQGTEARVLRRAYELIRDAYDERAFPLPAVIKKAIRQAGEQIYPEHRSDNAQWQPATASQRRLPTLDELEQWREANAWQTEVIDQYGSWANHWRATKHMHGQSGTSPIQIEPKAPPIANREHFAQRPGWKAGSLSEHERARAIENINRLTGDRSSDSEDAA